MSPSPMYSEAAAPTLPVAGFHRGAAKEVECPVCLGLHDEQIHDATLSVHHWFRGEVLKPFIYAMLADPEFRAMLDGLSESERYGGFAA